MEQSITLLLTASCMPQFSLRDLQSRINASNKVLIKKPDDQLLKSLLLKHFYERQLIVSKDVLDYIFTRAERSFAYIELLVTKIDELSLEEKRNITLPLVKKVIEIYLPDNVPDE